MGRWITKNGKRIWIEGGGGGGSAAVAIVLGVALATGGAVTAGVGAGASGSASSGTASSGARARLPDTAAVVARWELRGVRVTSRLDAEDGDCAEHAYGRVQDFLRDNPCVGMVRTVFEVRDRRRNVVLVAVSAVEMPDVEGARAYHELVDGEGTGNITELSRERGRYRDVRFTGAHYESHRDGAVVVNAQAQPAGRTAVAAELAQIVADAVG